MNSLNSYFDHIYYLNLDRRPDRRKSLEKHLDEMNITAERFPAVDGKAMFPEIAFPFAAEIATSMSHVAVWKTAVKLGFKSVLILEDDCRFENYINDMFPVVWKNLPADWVSFYFGGNHLDEPEKITNCIRRIKRTYCLHAYAMNINYLKPIIEGIESQNEINLKHHKHLSVTAAIDVIMLQFQAKLKFYCPHVNLASQEPGYSDIQESEVNYDDVLKKR